MARQQPKGQVDWLALEGKVYYILDWISATIWKINEIVATVYSSGFHSISLSSPNLDWSPDEMGRNEQKPNENEWELVKPPHYRKISYLVLGRITKDLFSKGSWNLGVSLFN